MRRHVSAALCLLFAASALAQDPPASVPQKARPPAPVDPEARAALEEARAIRARASCMTRAAQAMESTARRLSIALGERDALRAELERARASLVGCDAAPVVETPRSPEPAAVTAPTIENIAVEWPKCSPGDPLCNDSTTFDAAPIVRTIRRNRAGFVLCNDGRQSSRAGGHVRLLLQLKEIGDDARPTSVQIEEDTLNDAAATRCLSRSAARLVFPSATSAARVRLTVRMPGR